MSREEYENFCDALKGDYNKKTGSVITRLYDERTDTTTITFFIKGKPTPYKRINDGY